MTCRFNMTKYRAVKCTYDGIRFDSKKEMTRYCELKLLEKAKIIKDLRLQVPFELIPKSKTERAAVYKADFVYTESDTKTVEDVKGYRTKEYILKRKLFKHLYPEYRFIET